MSTLNKSLVKAGVISLINDKESDFIERFSFYLAEKPELIDYFFDGPLEITVPIKQKIEALIKKEIAVESDFLGITELKVGFDWSSEQVYKVKYKVKRYFDGSNSSYTGQAVKDGAHPICREIILEKSIEPRHLN